MEWMDYNTMICYRCGKTTEWCKIDNKPFCYDCWAHGITKEDLFRWSLPALIINFY